MNSLLYYLRMNKSCRLSNGASHGTLVHRAGVGGEVISGLYGVSIVILYLVVHSCIISTLHNDLCVRVCAYQYCVYYTVCIISILCVCVCTVCMCVRHLICVRNHKQIIAQIAPLLLKLMFL